MKLWLISQEENNDYDTYDSAVVVAETETDAKATHPSKQFPRPASEWGDIGSNWASTPDNVTAICIGEALPDMTAGVICASFNAG